MTAPNRPSWYVEVVQGGATDRAGLRPRWETEMDRLATVEGWLGATGGIAGSGGFVAAVRFSSADVARAAVAGRTSWPDAGPGTSDVGVVMGGGSDEAGFVQLMQAEVADRARFEEIEAAMGDDFARHRPDFLGGYRAWFPGSRLTVVDYFRSQSEARAGEAKPLSDELGARFEDWMALLSDVRWLDLPDPWLASSTLGAPDSR